MRHMLAQTLRLTKKFIQKKTAPIVVYLKQKTAAIFLFIPPVPTQMKSRYVDASMQPATHLS